MGPRPRPRYRAAPALLLVVLLAACRATVPAAPIVEPPPVPEPTPRTESEAERWLAAVPSLARGLLEEAARHRVADVGLRTATHRRLWGALAPLVDSAQGLGRREIGHSVEGRPLYAIDFGRGPVRVMLWSQMHGNEPTATLALADLIRFFAQNPDHPVVRRIGEQLTLVAIPMLNPDGAERGQRANYRGIDINRDARTQASPEARALAAAHSRFSPHFGFNLHDLTAPWVVDDGRPVAISLMAPPPDPERSDIAARTRAKQIAAIMRMAADSLVDGRVTRYDETFNPQAFGDAMQSWGTSTVLLETGTWDRDPEKEYLRQVNFVLLLAALDGIATGAYRSADLQVYETLPPQRLASQRQQR